MSKKRNLTKKVLCGLIAATTMGISGTALAADDGNSTANAIIVEDTKRVIEKEDTPVNVDKISTSGTGSLIVKGDVTAVDIDAQSQTINQDEDGISIGSSVIVNDNKLTSSGTINAVNSVVVRGNGSLKSTGTVKATGIDFDGANSENNVNNLEATGSIGVSSGEVIATGKLTSKWLSVDTNASLTAKDVEVTEVYAGGKLSVNDTMKAASLELTGPDADVTLNNGAEITGDIFFWDGGKLTADGLVKANSIAADGPVALNGGATVAKNIDVTGGPFTAGGTVKADTLTINNKSIENKVENLDVSTIDVKRGAIVASGNVVAGDINANGSYPLTSEDGVKIGNSIVVTGDGSLTSTGTVKASNISFYTDKTHFVNNMTADNSIIVDYGSVIATGKLTAGERLNISKPVCSLSAQAVEADYIKVSGTMTVTDTVKAGKLYLSSATSDVTLKNGAEVSGDIIAFGGKLTAGGTVHAKNMKYFSMKDLTVNNLIADETLIVGGNLTANGAVKANDVTLSEATVVVAGSGSLTATKMNVEEDSTVTGNAAVTDTLTVGEGKVLNVGSREKAGQLTVNELSGGTLFIDPAFKDGVGIEGASGLAVGSTTVGSALVAGENSKIALGTANLSDADTEFYKTGLNWGASGITSGVYVATTADVSTGSITANGALTSAPATTAASGTVDFEANSILMVNGDSTKTTAAITGVTQTPVVADSAKLYIDNAQKNETYHILAGSGVTEAATAENGAAWVDDNITSKSSLLKFSGKSTNGAYDVTSSVKSVKDVYGDKIITPDVYDKALSDSTNNELSNFAFAANNSDINATEDAQINAMNSASTMTEQAGVSHTTYAVSNLLTDAVADHVSLASGKDHDKDVWAKYVHTKENISNLGAANIGATYDAQYNGIIIGSDIYKNGKSTVGAALTYVDGSINGRTMVASTRNEASYYGASIYGSIQNEDSAVIGDITYLHGSHDISQYNSTYKLTGDAKSDAFGFGVRAEKSFKSGVGKFVPYAGLRYMHLGTGNYTNSIGMTYDTDDANLWMLPVGVKYSADIKSGSCIFRPVAELGYVWNMGDRSGTQTAVWSGAKNSFGYDVADRGSWFGHLGFEVEKDNLTYSLGFEYQKGSSVKSNRWVASLNWSF